MKKVPLIATGLSGLMGSQLKSLYEQQFEFENIDLTAGIDITDLSAVLAAVANSPAETIIHLAAYTDVTKAHEQYSDTKGLCYRINVDGTQNIVTAAKETGKHLIHISTDFVFDGKKESAYTETDVPNPIEWYGHTKLLAEEIVQSQLDHYTILRLANPYQDHPSRPDFVAKIVAGLKKNTLHPQFTNRYITPTFIDDIAKICAYCAVNHPTGIYHAVGSSWHTNYEIAVLIQEQYNIGKTIKKTNLDHFLETATRPYQKSLKISNAKIIKEFNIIPKTFLEGLQELSY